MRGFKMCDQLKCDPCALSRIKDYFFFFLESESTLNRLKAPDMRFIFRGDVIADL